MSFPSDRHLSRAIRVLLKMHQLDRFWDSPDIGDAGPSPLMRKEMALMAEGSSSLSPGEQVVLRVCMDLWSQSGGVSLADIIQKLNAISAHAIGELLVSTTNALSMDDWIERWKTFDAKASLDP